jgi:hypothetical protein
MSEQVICAIPGRGECNSLMPTVQGALDDERSVRSIIHWGHRPPRGQAVKSR